MKSASIPEDQKAIAKEILTKEFMSSEHSDIEEMEDGATRSVLVIKPLPWRGDKANRYLKRLDSKANSKKSVQSKQQTLQRVIGSNSTRPKPSLFPDEFWGFVMP